MRRSNSGESPPIEPGVPRVLLQPRPFILTGLPYRRDDALREVTRTARTGRQSYLTITYIATDERFPLPFGADRGLLAWITTKAVDDGWVTFWSISEYFRAFGLDDGGRGYRTFRERFQRVANLALRIETWEDGDRRVQRLFLLPESHEPAELLKTDTPAAKLRRKILSYVPYGFRLDENCWRELGASRIPTPITLLRAFHNAPQAWDFTQLVLYRCYIARQPSILPWAELVLQLGADDSDPRRLKYRLNQVLATIREHLPGFPARFLRGLRGLEVERWRGAC